MKAAKKQLDIFEGRQNNMESGLQYFKERVGGVEGRAQAIETVYNAFEGRAQAIELGLQSLRQSAEQNPIRAASLTPGLKPTLPRELLDKQPPLPPSGPPSTHASIDYRQDLEQSIRRLRQQSEELERRMEGAGGQVQPGPETKWREPNVNINLPRHSPRRSMQSSPRSMYGGSQHSFAGPTGAWSPEPSEIQHTPANPNRIGRPNQYPTGDYMVPVDTQNPRGAKAGSYCGACT